jgi:hypothetical protein
LVESFEHERKPDELGLSPADQLRQESKYNGHSRSRDAPRRVRTKCESGGMAEAEPGT